MRRRGNRAGAGDAWASAPELECLTLKNKSFIQRADDLACVSKVLVVALALSGKEGMDGVVKVVTPDSVKAVTTAATRTNDPLVVFVGLGDHANFASKFSRQRGNIVFDLRQYVRGGIVFDGLHRVQAQAVEMIFANPIAGVCHHIPADSLAARLIVIDGVAPWCFVAVGGKTGKQAAGICLISRMGLEPLGD